MEAKEVTELKLAASAIDLSSKAAMIARVNAQGDIIITTYGSPEFLTRIYQTLSHAWDSYGFAMTSVKEQRVTYRK